MADRHRISDIDEAARMGTCSVCGRVPLKRKTNSTKGYRWACRIAERRWGQNARRRGYLRLQKATSCERCGFVAEVPSQLDLHHLDGDRRNNVQVNLATLCANCHRWVHADGTEGVPKSFERLAA